MKRIIILLSLITPFFLLAASQQVEIKADSFEADETKRVSYFKGSVSLKKGSDEIKSNQLKINFNDKNKPLKYEASGDISFKITTDNQHFVGSAQTLIYQPTSQVYTIKGNVNIVETTKDRVLKGNKITINRISGKSKITGSKNNPVKFTFTVEEE